LAELDDFPMTDFSYRDTSARLIADTILKNSAVVLRGAITVDKIARIRSNLETIYSTHRRLLSGDHEAAAFFAKWDSGAVEALKDGNVAAAPYEAAFGKTASIRSFLKDRKFKRVCRLIFRRGKYYRTGTDNLMTVWSPSREKKANTSDGVDLHTDGMYFNDSRYGLTVWIPCDPCGRDAPGLEVVLAGHKEVREYTGFDSQRTVPANAKWNWHHYSDGVFVEKQLREHFPPERWLAPQFSPGDVMILSNWALHGTYRKSGMTRSRSAIQVRVEGKYFDPDEAKVKFLRRLFG
jgi:hypothetical protein